MSTHPRPSVLPTCIQAHADKLRKEIEEFGFPPMFPEDSEEEKQWDILRSLGIEDSDINKLGQ